MSVIDREILALMREVTDKAILPHFRSLSASEIENKAKDDVVTIAVGFVMAFIAGVFVVRGLLDFVSRHGFAPFAWWRIVVGGLGLVGLWLIG